MSTSSTTWRVDAHQHIWDLERHPQPWTADLPALHRSFSMDDVHADQDAAGVAGSVLVAAGATTAETVDLLALADTDPRILGVVGWVDLTLPSVAEDLAQLRERPGGHALVGVRHQLELEPDAGWLGRTDTWRGLRALADAGLCYDLVLQPHQLELAREVAASIPELPFVLDHLGKPALDGSDLSSWCSAITQLAEHEHVRAKVSGFLTQADWSAWSLEDMRPAVEHVLEQFGASRTMVGSDWPVSLLAGASYATCIETAAELLGNLSSAEAQAIWRDTAAQTYGLDVRA